MEPREKKIQSPQTPVETAGVFSRVLLAAGQLGRRALEYIREAYLADKEYQKVLHERELDQRARADAELAAEDEILNISLRQVHVREIARLARPVCAAMQEGGTDIGEDRLLQLKLIIADAEQYHGVELGQVSLPAQHISHLQEIL